MAFHLDKNGDPAACIPTKRTCSGGHHFNTLTEAAHASALSNVRPDPEPVRHHISKDTARAIARLRQEFGAL